MRVQEYIRVGYPRGHGWVYVKPIYETKSKGSYNDIVGLQNENMGLHDGNTDLYGNMGLRKYGFT